MFKSMSLPIKIIMLMVTTKVSLKTVRTNKPNKAIIALIMDNNVKTILVITTIATMTIVLITIVITIIVQTTTEMRTIVKMIRVTITNLHVANNQIATMSVATRKTKKVAKTVLNPCCLHQCRKRKIA